MLKFREYLKDLEGKKKYLINKKNVGSYTDKSEIRVISKGFFDIEDAYIIEETDGAYLFEVELVWKIRKKNDMEQYIYVKLTRQGRISYNRSEISEHVECKDEFLRICEKYIQQVVKGAFYAYQKTNYIGWVNDEEGIDYLGISRYAHALGHRYPELFNGEISDYKAKYENEMIKNIDFFPLLNIICGNENILGIFAYTIHSLYFFYGGLGKGHEFGNMVFSICIHGKEKEKVFMVANLFSNVFEYDVSNMYRIQPQSAISCSGIENRYVGYYRLESVPMLVKHKTNRITRNTSIIRTFQRGRMQGKIGFFPVYLSQCAINADEIIDFCTDDIFIEENLVELKQQINTILVFFICFLEQSAKECNEEECIGQIMDVLYANEIGRMRRNNQYDLNDIEIMSKVLLYIACRGFSLFLQHKLERIDLAAMLVQRSKKSFLENKPISTVRSRTDGAINFLMFIDSILSVEEKERSFLCVKSVEKRGGEECIYIDYEKGYKFYKIYCKQNKTDCLECGSLLKHLKQNSLLKMRTNRAQYFMQRTIEFRGEKQKQFLLVILYDAFEQLLDDA